MKLFEIKDDYFRELFNSIFPPDLVEEGELTLADNYIKMCRYTEKINGEIDYDELMSDSDHGDPTQIERTWLYYKAKEYLNCDYPDMLVMTGRYFSNHRENLKLLEKLLLKYTATSQETNNMSDVGGPGEQIWYKIENYDIGGIKFSRFEDFDGTVDFVICKDSL